MRYTAVSSPKAGMEARTVAVEAGVATRTSSAAVDPAAAAGVSSAGVVTGKGVCDACRADAAAVFAVLECQCWKTLESSVPFLPSRANVRLLIEVTNASSVSSLLVGISSVLAIGDVRLGRKVAGGEDDPSCCRNLTPYLRRALWRGQDIEKYCRIIDQSRIIDRAIS